MATTEQPKTKLDHTRHSLVFVLTILAVMQVLSVSLFYGLDNYRRAKISELRKEQKTLITNQEKIMEKLGIEPVVEEAK